MTSPDSASAGIDCCEQMWRRKQLVYAPFAQEMQAVYVPLVWSAFGREHAEASAVLETLARAAARRRGLLDHCLLLRRTRRAIGVALVIRAVRMTKAVLRREEDEEAPPRPSVRAPELRAVQLVNGDADALRGGLTSHAAEGDGPAGRVTSPSPAGGSIDRATEGVPARAGREAGRGSFEDSGGEEE